MSITSKRNNKSKKSRERLTALQRLRRTRTLAAFLRKVSSPYQHGWNRGHGLGQYTKQYTIDRFNSVGFVRRWNKNDLDDHHRNALTLYFAGAGGLKTEYTLALIDIDALKALGRGSTAGAIAYVKALQRIWPDLYWEPSTNGKGIHAYLLVDKRRFDAKGTNDALKRLQEYLRCLAVGHDIEQVEVKGTCPVIEWGTGGKIVSIHYGQLAKLPRDASRWEELRSTTCLTVHELMKLQVQAIGLTIGNSDKSSSPNEYTGSCSGVPFDKSLRERVEDGSLTELAREWIGGGISAGNRCNVSPAEFGFALATVAHCTIDCNVDGSLPTARAKAIWDAGSVEGLVAPWNHHKWKAIRNWLDAHGYLAIEDFGFTPGTIDRDGEYHKGYAARWGANEILLDRVSPTARTRIEGTASLDGETSEEVLSDSAKDGTNSLLEGTKTIFMAHKQHKDLRQGIHPREPNPLALQYGLPTYRSPFFRPPTLMAMRA